MGQNEKWSTYLCLFSVLKVKCQTSRVREFFPNISFKERALLKSSSRDVTTHHEVNLVFLSLNYHAFLDKETLTLRLKGYK